MLFKATCAQFHCLLSVRTIDNLLIMVIGDSQTKDNNHTKSFVDINKPLTEVHSTMTQIIKRTKERFKPIIIFFFVINIVSQKFKCIVKQYPDLFKSLHTNFTQFLVPFFFQTISSSFVLGIY